jgi:hypothetical protein
MLNKLQINIIWPTVSPFATHFALPFLAMPISQTFLIRTPKNVFQALRT